MKLLLDTHLVLWAAAEPHRLSAAARDLMAAPDNQLLCSVASLWEVAIKSSLGRPDFRCDVGLLRSGLAGAGYVELEVTGDHASAVAALPRLHGDPFDRLLVAQATVEGMLLLTADTAVARYPGPIRLV